MPQLCLLIFKNLSILERERGWGQIEGETESEADFPLSKETDKGLDDPMTLRS